MSVMYDFMCVHCAYVFGADHTCKCGKKENIKDAVKRLGYQQQKLDLAISVIKKQRDGIEDIIDYSIFMSKCYQKNYDTFANYDPEGKKLIDMNDEEKEYYHSIAERFSTVQGFSLRMFVENLSKKETRLNSLDKLKQSMEIINETQADIERLLEDD